ncbi:MAG: hypothetical protein AAB459_04440 [Patescibacteria group bacterium]
MFKIQKKLLFTGWVALFSIVFHPAGVLAAGLIEDIPDVDGLYSQRGSLHIKVRVIVHKVKSNNPAKPGGTAPTLVCGLSDSDSASPIPARGWRLPTLLIN